MSFSLSLNRATNSMGAIILDPYFQPDRRTLKQPSDFYCILNYGRTASVQGDQAHTRIG